METKCQPFDCSIGVRQGENLSPVLFAVYLNDLESFFAGNDVQNLQVIENICHYHLHIYIKLFVLLYADDTIIISETAESMQHALNVFERYCVRWKLNVNLSKTKVVVFCKRKSRTLPKFQIFNQSIEILDFYPYLRLTFNYNGSFATAKKRLSEQAQKALFSLYTKIRNLSIPVDLQLQLFDALVLPILTYGCEIWGFGNNHMLEKSIYSFAGMC